MITSDALIAATTTALQFLPKIGDFFVSLNTSIASSTGVDVVYGGTLFVSFFVWIFEATISVIRFALSYL